MASQTPQHVYMRPSPFAARLRLSQRCQSAMLRCKNKNSEGKNERKRGKGEGRCFYNRGVSEVSAGVDVGFGRTSYRT